MKHTWKQIHIHHSRHAQST